VVGKLQRLSWLMNGLIAIRAWCSAACGFGRWAAHGVKAMREGWRQALRMHHIGGVTTTWCVTGAPAGFAFYLHQGVVDVCD
jgi:hypothetical protein